MESHPATSNGRPADRRWKGHRHSFISRVPEDLAEIVKQKAQAEGVTYSDWIVEAIAARVDYPLTDQQDRCPDGSIQEEIPMQTAS